MGLWNAGSIDAMRRVLGHLKGEYAELWDFFISFREPEAKFSLPSCDITNMQVYFRGYSWERRDSRLLPRTLREHPPATH